jgi:hypothetical protein
MRFIFKMRCDAPLSHDALLSRYDDARH